MFRIRGDPPAINDAKFNEILQEQSLLFTTLRQFSLHSPIRKNCEQSAGDKALHGSSCTPGSTADDLWRRQIPGLFSPMQLDLIPLSRTSEGGFAQDNQPLVLDSPNSALETLALAINGCLDTDTVRKEIGRSSCSDLPDPTRLLNEALFSDDKSSLSDASSISDTISIWDMSSISDEPSTRNMPSRTATPIPVDLSPVPSTPASTPPSAHRAHFSPTPGHEEAPPASLEVQEKIAQRVDSHCVSDHGDDEDDGGGREHRIVHGKDYQAVGIEHGSNWTMNARRERSSLLDNPTDDAGNYRRDDSSSSWHDSDRGHSSAALPSHDTHAPMQPVMSTATRKRKVPPTEPSNMTKKPGRKPINPSHLQHIPSYMKQPDTFLNEILSQNNIDHGLAVLIQRSFYGVGHPQWFVLLRDACNILRVQQHHQRFPTSDGSLVQTHRFLSHLKNNDLLGPVLRRYGLADLVRHRNSARQFQRASPSVLSSMIRTCRPELHTATDSSVEFQKGLKLLRQDLSYGRHWYVLSEKFGPGILAVVPAQPPFGVSNSG